MFLGRYCICLMFKHGRSDHLLKIAGWDCIPQDGSASYLKRKPRKPHFSTIDIYWYMLISIDVYWCLLMSTLLISIDIYWYLLISIDVYWCLLMSIDVYFYWYLLISIDIYWYPHYIISPWCFPKPTPIHVVGKLISWLLGYQFRTWIRIQHDTAAPLMLASCKKKSPDSEKSHG